MNPIKFGLGEIGEIEGISSQRRVGSKILFG